MRSLLRQRSEFAGPSAAIGAPRRLFRNVGGRYGESTDQAHLYEFDYSHGVAVGDLNVDGFEDIMVANLGRPRVFLNQGDGSFQELLLDSLQIPSSFWVAPLLVDLDGDGLEPRRYVG